jgi:hypothetical protein
MKDKTIKYQDVYIYTHKDIKVFVKIDYIANEISLLNGNDLKPKNWVFAVRGVEYMNGWLTILEAMQMAIKDAKQRYEAELANSSKFS